MRCYRVARVSASSKAVPYGEKRIGEGTTSTVCVALNHGEEPERAAPLAAKRGKTRHGSIGRRKWNKTSPGMAQGLRRRLFQSRGKVRVLAMGFQGLSSLLHNIPEVIRARSVQVPLGVAAVKLWRIAFAAYHLSAWIFPSAPRDRGHRML